MRIYKDFSEARSEIARDLKEMGIEVETQSYQNRETAGREELMTMEIQNYGYTILNPSSIGAKDMHWAYKEFTERMDKDFTNPGEAWKMRRDYWKEFLTPEGVMDYTYNQRFYTPDNPEKLVELLKKDLRTRRAILPIFHPQDVQPDLNIRVPCSMYYHFLHRRGKLNMTYVMRSCDFSEHWSNDLWLAQKFNVWLCSKLNVGPGTLSHFVNSLHVYKKDIADVF